MRDGDGAAGTARRGERSIFHARLDGSRRRPQRIASAHRLELTHFSPPVGAVDILGEVAECYTGPTVLATDGWFIEF